VQGLCYFGPAQASNIVILDTLRRDLIEVSSSSYDLSLFSSKAGSLHDEGMRATSGGSHRGALAGDRLVR
jgi:hypothetical protein